MFCITFCIQNMTTCGHMCKVWHNKNHTLDHIWSTIFPSLLPFCTIILTSKIQMLASYVPKQCHSAVLFEGALLFYTTVNSLCTMCFKIAWVELVSQYHTSDDSVHDSPSSDLRFIHLTHVYAIFYWKCDLLKIWIISE